MLDAEVAMVNVLKLFFLLGIVGNSFTQITAFALAQSNFGMSQASSSNSEASEQQKKVNIPKLDAVLQNCPAFQELDDRYEELDAQLKILQAELERVNGEFKSVEISTQVSINQYKMILNQQSKKITDQINACTKTIEALNRYFDGFHSHIQRHVQIEITQREKLFNDQINKFKTITYMSGFLGITSLVASFRNEIRKGASHITTDNPLVVPVTLGLTGATLLALQLKDVADKKGGLMDLYLRNILTKKTMLAAACIGVATADLSGNKDYRNFMLCMAGAGAAAWGLWKAGTYVMKADSLIKAQRVDVNCRALHTPNSPSQEGDLPLPN